MSRLSRIELSTGTKIDVKETKENIINRILGDTKGFIELNERCKLESMSIDKEDQVIFEPVLVNLNHIVQIF